eukprot:gene24743-10675_t
MNELKKYKLQMYSQSQKKEKDRQSNNKRVIQRTGATLANMVNR